MSLSNWTPPAPAMAAAASAVSFLLLVVVTHDGHWLPDGSIPLLRFHDELNNVSATTQKNMRPKDELEEALDRVSTENKTLTIAVLNKAYVEENGMLDLLLLSFREGEGTEHLVDHLLFVAVDQTSFNRCVALQLHCYRLETEGVDFSTEVFYMSKEFLDMMWRRTLFLGDVLRRGYGFIFTDMDVIWLRNPFMELNHGGEDLLMSSDFYNGDPFDDANFFNTGFYSVIPNNKTVALFDEWYESRNNATGMNDQEALLEMKRAGVFRRLGLRVRYLDTTYFTGFCQKTKDFGRVLTVHSNCCASVRAKLTDLTAVLEAWKMSNGTSDAAWPAHTGFCL